MPQLVTSMHDYARQYAVFWFVLCVLVPIFSSGLCLDKNLVSSVKVHIFKKIKKLYTLILRKLNGTLSGW